MKKSTKLLYGLGFATLLGVTTAFATVSSVDGTAAAPDAERKFGKGASYWDKPPKNSALRRNKSGKDPTHGTAPRGMRVARSQD